jgi:hypothetical protein
MGIATQPTRTVSSFGTVSTPRHRQNSAADFSSIPPTCTCLCHALTFIPLPTLCSFSLPRKTLTTSHTATLPPSRTQNQPWSAKPTKSPRPPALPAAQPATLSTAARRWSTSVATADIMCRFARTRTLRAPSVLDVCFTSSGRSGTFLAHGLRVNTH